MHVVILAWWWWYVNSRWDQSVIPYVTSWWDSSTFIYVSTLMWLQEELMFSSCPELQAAQLFMTRLKKREAIQILGHARYGKCSGYGETLRYCRVPLWFHYYWVSRPIIIAFWVVTSPTRNPVCNLSTISHHLKKTDFVWYKMQVKTAATYVFHDIMYANFMRSVRVAKCHSVQWVAIISTCCCHISFAS